MSTAKTAKQKVVEAKPVRLPDAPAASGAAPVASETAPDASDAAAGAQAPGGDQLGTLDPNEVLGREMYEVLSPLNFSGCILVPGELVELPRHQVQSLKDAGIVGEAFFMGNVGDWRIGGAV